MPRADWSFLKKLELSAPNDELLAKYQAIFDVLFSEIVDLLRIHELLIASRAHLLPRLISGELSLHNSNVEYPPNMKIDLARHPAPPACHA
jgi:hypothetical protein